MTVTVYTFRGWRDAWVSVADKHAVLACFGTEAHFATYFAGFLQYRDFDTDQRWWGVWGRRTAARFRRLMAAHHGVLAHVGEPPPPPPVWPGPADPALASPATIALWPKKQSPTCRRIFRR